eukprot:Hpha_TRINITY_DN16796_c5_g5::TRINITY_DN16796_c5_g5_i1::g.80004::m.80004
MEVIPAVPQLSAYSIAVEEEAQGQTQGLEDEIQECASLRRWRLFVNEKRHILEIPAGISRCSALRDFDASRNERLAVIPECISSLAPSLQLLDVSSCALRSLPDGICKLHSLRTLRLSHNLIEALPPDFGKLSALQECLLDHNRILCLPASCRVFADPEHPLHTLTLAGNPLLPIGGEGRELPDASPEDPTCNMPECGRYLGRSGVKYVCYVEVKNARRVPLLYHLCGTDCVIPLSKSVYVCSKEPRLGRALNLPRRGCFSSPSPEAD